MCTSSKHPEGNGGRRVAMLCPCGFISGDARPTLVGDVTSFGGQAVHVAGQGVHDGKPPCVLLNFAVSVELL